MIFGIEKGILCQQVNCQNAIGAGLSGAIADKYPVVNEKYHEAFTKASKEVLFGKAQLIQVEDELYIANLFTQFRYGNSWKTHECYTDTEKLIGAIDRLAEKYPDINIYVPAYIGCGLAGGNWSEVTGRLFSLERNNLYMVDTNKEPFLKTSLFIPQLSLRDDFPIDIDPSLYTGRILAFDTETTGLGDDNEILQLSIVNEKEEVVLSTYFKPEKHTEWVSAMEINHISPDMVKDAPYIRHYRALLQEIFDKAELIVGHNVSFDIKMLKQANVDIPIDKTFCTCTHFKKNHSEGHHALADAIKYYCPQALMDYMDDAHNALPDTIAAMRVYLAIKCKEDYSFDFNSPAVPVTGKDIAGIYQELTSDDKELG